MRDIIKDRHGKTIAIIDKSQYPLHTEVETNEGTKHYVTIKTNAGKLCTSTTVIPKLINTNYLLRK
jgi:hypothetical protein